MEYKSGTKIKITQIKEKKLSLARENFEETPRLLTGCTGEILECWQCASDFSEGNTYWVAVQTIEGIQEYELEEDEFEII